MQRTCVKCSQVNRSATGAPGEACPACGAIYDKAQAGVSRPVRPWSATTAPSLSGMPSQFGSSDAGSGGGSATGGVPHHVAFARSMRAETLYPNFRAVVRVCTVLGIALAAVMALIGVVALLKGNAMTAIGALVAAALVAAFCAVSRELSLMLADLSDAAVRLAAGREGQ